MLKSVCRINLMDGVMMALFVHFTTAVPTFKKYMKFITFLRLATFELWSTHRSDIIQRNLLVSELA